MLIYKGLVYPFVPAAYGIEVFVLFPWAIIEAIRMLAGKFTVTIGSRGNKMEEIKPSLLFLVLSATTIVAHLFYAFWQSYVLLLDLVLHLISLVVVIGQVISASLLVLSLSKV